MSDKKHKKIKIVKGDYNSAIDEYELGLKKNELSKIQTEQKLKSIKRVQSGEATRIDSAMAGYPISALSKDKKSESISDASIESLLSYYRNAPLSSVQDSVVMQMVTDELNRRTGNQKNDKKDNKSNITRKSKTETDTKITLPWNWKSTLRRAQNTDDVTGYLKQKGFSEAQIKEAIRRDQSGE